MAAKSASEAGVEASKVDFERAAIALYYTEVMKIYYKSDKIELINIDRVTVG
jgi:hypothetical protein